MKFCNMRFFVIFQRSLECGKLLRRDRMRLYIKRHTEFDAHSLKNAVLQRIEQESCDSEKKGLESLRRAFVALNLGKMELAAANIALARDRDVSFVIPSTLVAMSNDIIASQGPQDTYWTDKDIFVPLIVDGDEDFIDINKEKYAQFLGNEIGQCILSTIVNMGHSIKKNSLQFFRHTEPVFTDFSIKFFLNLKKENQSLIAEANLTVNAWHIIISHALRETWSKLPPKIDGNGTVKFRHYDKSKNNALHNFSDEFSKQFKQSVIDLA